MFVELQGIHSYSPSMAGKSVQHCSLLHSGLPLHMGITPLCLGLHNDDFGYGLFVWNESWHSSDRDFCRRWYFHGSSVQQGLSRQVHRKVASQSGDRRHSVWKSLKKSNLTHFVTLQAKWAFKDQENWANFGKWDFLSNFQTLFEGSLLGTVRCLLSSQQNAFQLAFLARLTPIPFGIQNSLFALSPISTRDYLQASVVGMFPCQAINVYLGSTVRSMEEVRTTGCPNKFGMV